MQSVCDIQVRLRAAFVKDFIPFPNSSYQIPFLIPHKTACVHTLRCNLDVELPTIVSPGAKLDGALLLVEGKPGEVQLAGGGEDVGGDPKDVA